MQLPAAVLLSETGLIYLLSFFSPPSVRCRPFFVHSTHMNGDASHSGGLSPPVQMFDGSKDSRRPRARAPPRRAAPLRVTSRLPPPFSAATSSRPPRLPA